MVVCFSKQGLFIHDLLFVECYMFSGDDGIWLEIVVNLAHFDVEFLNTSLIYMQY